MYRLLLVDDEIEVIEYFSRLFRERSGLPLEVFTARAAQEALDCLDNLRIDIVLSDIKMPRMNGLQMYGVIKKRWPHCKVVFLSGVLEFDYVYSSIQERQVRYLTKLEPVEKIIATVQEVMEEIEREYQQSLSAQRLQEQLNQALPLLQSQCLFHIINGLAGRDADLQPKLDELQIPLRAAENVWMAGGMFDCDFGTQPELEFQRGSLQLRSMAATYFGNYFRFACYLSDQRLFLWILQFKEAGGVSAERNPQVLLAGQLEYIQAACRETLGLSVSFVYADCPLQLAAAQEGFIQIKAALGNKRSLSEDSVVISCGAAAADQLLWENPDVVGSRRLLIHLNMLEGYLELGQEKEFFSLLSRMIDSLRAVESKNYGPALEIYYSVSTLFMRTINTYHLTEQLAFRMGLYKLLRLDEHESWDAAVDYLYQLAHAIFTQRFDNADRCVADAVLYVQKYVGEHLADDLTLVTLADLANLNPSYLSRLFKERTGKNLYEYILEIRIAKAQELLRHSTERIQDIAVLVGYDSAQSFTRVFRRATGKSPSEYRDEV